MFPLPPKKDPKAIVAAFLQSVSNKPALPQAVARAAPQIVRPPAPAVRGGNNLDALTLGGGALGAGLGGLAVSALGGPVGLGLGIGGALGVAAPQIYDYFTRPSGPPPPTLPQSILNKPSSAPQYNIGVNRSQTYREGGVFGPQPKIQGWNGDTPLLEAPPTDGSFISQMANWATQKAWEGKLANEKQAFENPLQEATLGLPGRIAKNYVGDLGLSLLTLPERLKGVASRTSAMPSNISKPYGFLFGQNPEWSPNEKEGKGLIMELLRTLEPEGQGIEQAYGFIRGVTGFGANSREQALNYKLSDLKLDAGKRADEISKFRKTGRWPTELVETPDAVDFVGAHLSDSINNAEATFNKLPVGEQMLAFFLFPAAAEQLLPKVIPKLGKMERAYAPSGSLLSDVSMIKKGVERTVEMQRQSVLAYTNKATPFITHSNNAISGLIGNTDWVHPNTALQSMRRFLVSKGFSTFDLDQASKARIAIEHGLEPILEQFFRLGDGDNFGQILDGLMDINNYGVGGFIEEATSKESIALKMFEDMRMLDEPVSKQMSKITGLKEGTIINPLNSTNGLIGRKILSNMIEGVTEQSELVRLGKQETLVDLLNTVRNTDFSKIKSKAEYDIAKNLVGESQKRLVDWALNSTLQVDFKIKDLDAFKKVGDWKKWQSFFAKMYHIGPVPGVGVRNVLSDITKLYLQDRELMTVNSSKYLDAFMGPERKLFSQIRGQLVGKRSVSSRGVESLEISKKPNAFIEGGAMVMKGGEDFMHRHITAAVIKKVMNRYFDYPHDASELAGLPAELIQKITKSVKGSLRSDELIALQREYLTNPNSWFLHPSFSDALSGLDADGVSLEISARVREALSKNSDNPEALQKWIRQEILRVNKKKSLVTNPPISRVNSLDSYKVSPSVAQELSQTKVALGANTPDIDVALYATAKDPDSIASQAIQKDLIENYNLSPEHIAEQQKNVVYYYDHENRVPDSSAQAPSFVGGLSGNQINIEAIAQGMPEILRNVAPNARTEELYRDSLEMYNEITGQLLEMFTAIRNKKEVIDLSKYRMLSHGNLPEMTYAEYLNIILTDNSAFKKRHGGNGYTAVPSNQMHLLQSHIGQILTNFKGKTGEEVSKLVTDVRLQIAKSMELEKSGQIPEVSSAAFRAVAERMYKIKNDAVNQMAWNHYSIISQIEGGTFPKMILREAPLKVVSAAAEQKIADSLIRNQQRAAQALAKAEAKTAKAASKSLAYIFPFSKGGDPLVLSAKRSEYTAAINSIRLEPSSFTKVELSALRRFPNSDMLTREDSINMLRNLGIETVAAQKIVDSVATVALKEITQVAGEIRAPLGQATMKDIETVLNAAIDAKVIPLVEGDNVKLFQLSRDLLHSDTPVMFANEQFIKVRYQEGDAQVYKIDRWLSKNELIVTKEPLHATDEMQQLQISKQRGMRWEIVPYGEKADLQAKHEKLGTEWFGQGPITRQSKPVYTVDSYLTAYYNQADLTDPASRAFYQANKKAIKEEFKNRAKRLKENATPANILPDPQAQMEANAAATADNVIQDALAPAPTAVATDAIVDSSPTAVAKNIGGKWGKAAKAEVNAQDSAIKWTVREWIDRKLAGENMGTTIRSEFLQANNKDIYEELQRIAKMEEELLKQARDSLFGEVLEAFDDIVESNKKLATAMRKHPSYKRVLESLRTSAIDKSTKIQKEIMRVATRKEVKRIIEEVVKENRTFNETERLFLDTALLSYEERSMINIFNNSEKVGDDTMIYITGGTGTVKRIKIEPFSDAEKAEIERLYGSETTSAVGGDAERAANEAFIDEELKRLKSLTLTPEEAVGVPPTISDIELIKSLKIRFNIDQVDLKVPYKMEGEEFDAWVVRNKIPTPTPDKDPEEWMNETLSIYDRAEIRDTKFRAPVEFPKEADLRPSARRDTDTFETWAARNKMTEEEGFGTEEQLKDAMEIYDTAKVKKTFEGVSKNNTKFNLGSKKKTINPEDAKASRQADTYLASTRKKAGGTDAAPIQTDLFGLPPASTETPQVTTDLIPPATGVERIVKSKKQVTLDGQDTIKAVTGQTASPASKSLLAIDRRDTDTLESWAKRNKISITTEVKKRQAREQYNELGIKSTKEGVSLPKEVSDVDQQELAEIDLRTKVTRPPANSLYVTPPNKQYSVNPIVLRKNINQTLTKAKSIEQFEAALLPIVEELILVATRSSKSGLFSPDATKELIIFSDFYTMAQNSPGGEYHDALMRAVGNIEQGVINLIRDLDKADSDLRLAVGVTETSPELITAKQKFYSYWATSGLKFPTSKQHTIISLDELFNGRLTTYTAADKEIGGIYGFGDYKFFDGGVGGGGGADDDAAFYIGEVQNKFLDDAMDSVIGAEPPTDSKSVLNQQMLTGTEQEKIKVPASVKALQALYDSINTAKNEKIVSAIDPQNAAYVNSIQKYFNKNLRELTLARTVAERTAATSVDNYIYNYGEKYNYDHIMEMAFGYPHWYLRTFSDYPRQILSDPNYLSKLFSWNRDINSINEDDSNLPLWMRASVPLNIEKFGLRDIMGTDTVYLPILSQLSPLESLLNGDFTNATREKSSLGSLYNKIYGWGPGPHALVPLAIGTTLMGLSKLNNNESQMDEASQYFGYLGSQTRLLPLLTAQIEKSGAALPISGGVAVDAPLMLMSSLGAFGAPNANIGFRALMAASSMAQFFATHAFTKDGLKFVGPVYDQRRVANVLTAWGNEPGKVINGIAITPEILQDAAIVSRDPYLLGARKEYSSAYSVWSSAVTESRAQKLLPQLLSYFGGPGVSARGENEILQEQMYNRVDKLYDMQKDPATNKDDYEKAWLSFSIQYPNFPVYSMFKKYGNDAFQVYAYSALSRVGRGASAKAVYDTVGLDYNVVNKFFANKGKFEYGTEHAQFKEGIVRLALLLQSPDMSTKQEWGEAGQLYHQLQREMENMFPGTTAMQDVYFDLDTKDRGQFLMDHLDLKTRMDTELATMVQDPKYKTKMAPYYVSIKDAGDFLKMSYTSRDPQKAAAYQIYLENSRDWAAKKEKQFLADFDLFEFHRGYNKVVANLDNSIASLTAGLNLPKLPKIRLDSPEIEARKTMQNALETMSTKNLQQQFKSNAIMSGMGAGATGAVGMAGGTGGAGATSMAGMAGNDLLSSWEYLYSQKAAPTINYVSELGDQLKFQTLQPLLEGLNGNSVSFANALNAPLLSGKWATFQDPLKWEESLVNYVKMLGGENLRSSMMLEASRGVPFDPKQMVWSKVIGTVKSLSNAEIGMLMSKHPELRDLPQVKAESANYGGPTLNALFDVVGASVNIQEDGTISISGETLKKSKSGSGSGSGSDRLKSGDIEDYISKWSKHYYGNNIEQLYDQYIMVNVSQGEVAGRQFWKKYPQLAQYQAFSNKLWDRYKKNKGGPSIANRKKDLDNIIKGVGVMVGSSRQKAMGDKNQGAFSVMSSMIKNSGLSKLPPSSVESRYGNGNRIDGKIYANVISVIKAKNPQLAVSFAEFIQTNPTRRQALLQANPDLSRYITLFTPEQLGEIEDSYNVGLEIGGDSLSRGGGVRVYKRRTGRTGL